MLLTAQSWKYFLKKNPIKGHTSNSIGKCKAEIELKDLKYANVCLSVLQGLLTDVVLGQDFKQQHEGNQF